MKPALPLWFGDNYFLAITSWLQNSCWLYGLVHRVYYLAARCGYRFGSWCGNKVWSYHHSFVNQMPSIASLRCDRSLWTDISLEVMDALVTTYLLKQFSKFLYWKGVGWRETYTNIIHKIEKAISSRLEPYPEITCRFVAVLCILKWRMSSHLHNTNLS